MIQDTWNWLFDATIHDITLETGCIHRCSFMKYEIRKHEDIPITWNTTKWVSEFYVYTDSSHVLVSIILVPQSQSESYKFR